MTKLAQRGRNAAASSLAPYLALLALAAALLLTAVFPASGLAAEEGEGPTPDLSFSSPELDLGKATPGTETAATVVDVSNLGASAVAIDKVTLEGGEAGDFKLTGSNCGWLEPGHSCSAWVSFMPSATGVRQTALVVQPKEAPAASLPVSGSGVAAQISFTPGSHDFGIQRTNESASSWFQLSNSGEAFVQVGSTGIGGPDSGNFWVNNSDCWSGRRLEPGESCNLQVNFNAWDMVAYAAELQASANGGTATAALAGTGGRAMLEPDAQPLELGDVGVGTVGAVRAIVLTNNGNFPGAFFIAVVAGGDSGSFELLDESCTGGMVMPGATCVAHVRFQPQSAGPKLARLAMFGDGDGGTMVMLSGNGVAPAVTLAPESHDFGELARGEKSSASAFAVRNDGSAPLALGGVAIVGADLDQFALGGDDCSETTLAPGAECLVRVRFAPDSAGAKAAKLRIGSAGGSFVAALSGTGLGALAGEERFGPQHGNAAAAGRTLRARGAIAAIATASHAATRSPGQPPAGPPHRPPPAHASALRVCRFAGVSEAATIRAVLFDIDGTLLVTGGAGAVAWQRAFRELHGIDANIEEHTHAGMTDPEIAAIVFREVIGREGDEAERAEAIAGYLSHLEDAVNESERLPGDAGDRGGVAAAGRAGCPARNRHRQHRIGRPHQARPRQPQPLLRLRRLRLGLARSHRADQAGDRARRRRRRQAARPGRHDRRRRHPARRHRRSRRRHPRRRRRHRQLHGRAAARGRCRLGAGDGRGRLSRLTPQHHSALHTGSFLFVEGNRTPSYLPQARRRGEQGFTVEAQGGM